VSRRKAAAGPPEGAWVYPVSELNRAVRLLVEQEFPEIWVEGEVSNCRLQNSGHCYFTLKDHAAQLACVLFRSAAGRLKMPLQDGMQIQVCGELSLYEARGQFQMIVRHVQEQGAGLLHAKFEALKKKLDAEGLFAPERKKALPKFPQRIGIVTSPTGAALRDMLHVLNRRAPWLSILLSPARVQGQGAAEELVEALHRLDRAQENGLPAVEVILFGRGGGSLEDLWPFNEEIVARAVVACRTPVIAGVGHEIDFTISDFVADLRAPTPSAAAELVAPDRMTIRESLSGNRERMRRMLVSRMEKERLRWERLSPQQLRRQPVRSLEAARQQLDLLMNRFELAGSAAFRAQRERLESWRHRLKAQAPAHKLAETRERMERLRKSLNQTIRRLLEQQQQVVAKRTSMLRLLGPQKVLERGYTLVFDEEGQLITRPDETKRDETLQIRFAQGGLKVGVQSQIEET